MPQDALDGDAEATAETRAGGDWGRTPTRLLRVLREIGVRGSREATRESAREFRLALEELGATFVKLGQLLSSRPDLLPDVYVEELGKLVDEVPPLPFEAIAPVIERSLGSEIFVRIDREPLAAASIAQIHAALLKDGREVVADFGDPPSRSRGGARPGASAWREGRGRRRA